MQRTPKIILALLLLNLSALSACKPETKQMTTNPVMKSEQDKKILQEQMEQQVIQLLNQEKHADAVAQLKKYALEQNDVKYIAALGVSYTYGMRSMQIEPNGQEAIYWLDMAATKGDTSAYSLLAGIYQYGLAGVEPNPAKALELLNQSAKRGDPEGMTLLGTEYYLGNLVPKNDQKAYDYLTQASEKNESVALLYLAKFYLEGIVVKEDRAKGAQLIQKSAQLGNTDSLLLYGKALFFGNNIYVKKDESLGLEYLQKAALLGQKKAIEELIAIYSHNPKYKNEQKVAEFKQELPEDRDFSGIKDSGLDIQF